MADGEGSWKTIDVGDESVRMYVVGDVTDRGPGVVVLHAWWGLVDDITDYADQLAGRGFTVVAPDLVRGTTAATVADAERIVNGADDDHCEAVTLAAVDWLAANGVSSVGTVGFSFGAWWAVVASGARSNVRGSVVYYGAAVPDNIGSSDAPVLANMAENDPFESDEFIQMMVNGLTDAGRRIDLHTYPDTGHWFAEPSRDAYAPAAADLAFNRTVQFLTESLTG
ncbi:MAG: dienelactone hydrolase family protein [Acidimicrobiia bacterium]|nr:dienelactone hydrolase family protein [Acidimicrobiia bacterium]